MKHKMWKIRVPEELVDFSSHSGDACGKGLKQRHHDG